MRVMFIGSIPGHLPGTSQNLVDEHQPLFTAARELGYAAVEAGHRVIIGSTSARTVDAYILQGVASFCRNHSERSAHVEVHRPDSEPAKLPTDVSNLHFLPCAHHADPSNPYKWIVAHARAADEADVVIAIAGSTSTRLVGHLAADRGKPLIAIPTFGGAAEDLFHNVRYGLARISVDGTPATTLLSEWNTGSAQSIIKLAEALVAATVAPSPHIYFLSYSWNDCTMADHVEMLLRREHRPVLRDEADLEAGGPLSKGVQALIEECDTFVALWSPGFNGSSWCPQELEYAINLRHAGRKPKRIVLLVLEEHPRPLRLTDQLSLPGTTRGDRELAVVRLVRGEV